MPELPEVETVRRGLEAGLRGRLIERVTLHRPDLRLPFPAGLAQALEGQRVEAARRRAKYLLLDVGAHTLIGHLGMSGTFVLRETGSHSRQPHEHMIWTLEGQRELVYHDPRRFGFVLLCPRGQEASHPALASLGREPLEEDTNAQWFAAQLDQRRAPIKATLLDQRVLAGVGNIYACEALYRTRLHPATPSHACIEHAPALLEAVRAVLHEAIASGGSTLRNYASASGKPGYFQHAFAVYGREGAACLNCGEVVLRIVQSGRSTFFCPACQPRYTG